MPRHSPYKPKRTRSCKGKRRFRDHQEAIHALHKASGSSRTIKPVRTYFCPTCKGFHLTSRS